MLKRERSREGRMLRQRALPSPVSAVSLGVLSADDVVTERLEKRWLWTPTDTPRKVGTHFGTFQPTPSYPLLPPFPLTPNVRRSHKRGLFFIWFSDGDITMARRRIAQLKDDGKGVEEWTKSNRLLSPVGERDRGLGPFLSISLGRHLTSFGT